MKCPQCKSRAFKVRKVNSFPRFRCADDTCGFVFNACRMHEQRQDSNTAECQDCFWLGRPEQMIAELAGAAPDRCPQCGSHKLEIN